jgi:hypothetical protein
MYAKSFCADIAKTAEFVFALYVIDPVPDVSLYI